MSFMLDHWRGTSPSSSSWCPSDVNAVEIEDEEPPFSRSVSASAGATSTGGDRQGIVFVAVGKEIKDGKSVLGWALRNVKPLRKVVLTHVHCPDKLIPMGLGGWFPAEKLNKEQLSAYRLTEWKKMEKTLDEYMLVCKVAKVQAEKLVIEMDDIAKGLMELISQTGITQLVMGAASDKKYSKKMKAPKSKIATAIQRDAPNSCRIWFICKSYLVCTREPGVQSAVMPQTTTSNISPSSSISSNQSLASSSRSSSQSGMAANPLHQFFRQKLRSHAGMHRAEASNSQVEGASRSSYSSHPPSWSGGDETASKIDASSVQEESESGSMANIIPAALEFVDGTQLSSAQDQQDLTWKWNNDLFDRLHEAITEAEKSKDEAYEESLKRRTAERDLLQANRKARDLEMNCAEEVKLRKQIEEELAREKMETRTLKEKLVEMIKELDLVSEQNLRLEMQVKESDCVISELKEKLTATGNVVNALQIAQDIAHPGTEELHLAGEDMKPQETMPNSSEFSVTELEQATCNFDSALKIGEGGHGSVYLGFLRHTLVAIKVFHAESPQFPSAFHQEVGIHTNIRHPNLVTLIGVCLEAYALIYEFLPGGSLEDRLSCKDNAPPLSWQKRIQISADICSALIFLHSYRPQSVVHGDLKPANILFDANLEVKLSDFGVSRLLSQSSNSTMYRYTDPKGTFLYTDPEFVLTGELTTRSDTYSFGIILLRLLTGKSPLGVVREVREALEKGRLQNILDPLAGNWSLVQAQQIARLGLSCCEMTRKNRPDLVRGVWSVLGPLKTALLGSSLGLSGEDGSYFPPYLTSPILQDIMKTHHSAAE